MYSLSCGTLLLIFPHWGSKKKTRVREKKASSWYREHIWCAFLSLPSLLLRSHGEENVPNIILANKRWTNEIFASFLCCQNILPFFFVLCAFQAVDSSPPLVFLFDFILLLLLLLLLLSVNVNLTFSPFVKINVSDGVTRLLHKCQIGVLSLAWSGSSWNINKNI